MAIIDNEELELKQKTRTCSGCKQDKPATSEFFYARAAWKNRKATLMSKCCDCHNRLSAAYRNRRKEKNPEKLRQDEAARVKNYRKKLEFQDPGKLKQKYQQRRWSLKAHWNITLEQFDAMLLSQKNSCALCRTEDPGKRGWMIDHDHQTDSVRGILCKACNTGLGLLGDTEENLLRAVAYLQRPPMMFPEVELPPKREALKENKERECKSCGKSFVQQKHNQKICSRDCHMTKCDQRRPPKDVLARQVWESTCVDLGKCYGVSDVTVKKWCKEYDLVTPKMGYWITSEGLAARREPVKEA